MNQNMTVSYFDNISLLEKVEYIISIENNYILLVDKENKKILIYNPNDYFIFNDFDDENIIYVKKLNNNDIFICFEEKFFIIKINFENKSFEKLMTYNLKDNINFPNLTEFYNENKLLLIETKNIFIFDYKKNLNNEYIINLQTIINNENINYYNHIYRYSYHPKNDKKEFLIIAEKEILFYNSITYQINDTIKELNNYLLENDTNVIEWKDNCIFICDRICFYILDTNNHQIIYKCSSSSTTCYYFESIQLLKYNLMICGIIIRGCFNYDFGIMIFPLNTLYQYFNSWNILYCEIIKGGLVNLVVSEKKDYFGVIYGKDSQFKCKFGKINYNN
jgi:hypothetical protein